MTCDFNYRQNDCDAKIFSYEGKICLTSQNEKMKGLYDRILSVFDENHNHYLDSHELRIMWNNVFFIEEECTDENNDGILSKKELQKIINQNPLFKKIKITAEELTNFLSVIDKTITKSFAKSFAVTAKKLPDVLKVKYPQDKYEIKILSDNYIEIYDKKDDKIVVKCNISGNGNYIFTYIKDNEPIKWELYDTNGKLKKYSVLEERNDCLEWVDGNPISDSIYRDISTKNKIGLPTTGKDIEKHIKQITPNNVIEVLRNYEDSYGESLLKAIDSEWGLDKNVKARIKAHLNKCILQSSYWKLNKPNTKLDKDFGQGKTGDCWFLAAIAAIKRSPKGKKLLNETIKDNGDGTYTVKLKGTKKEYTVSALEIISNSKYANGDLDVRILEIAAYKHFFTGIDGGNPADAFELLLGTGEKWKNVVRNFSPKPGKEKIEKLLENPNIVITTAIAPWSKLYGLIVKSIDDEKEYKGDIATAHAYAVVGIDDNNIYLINPWYTDTPIAIPLDVFEEYWANVQYTEIT